jgi:hypothetical protein
MIDQMHEQGLLKNVPSALVVFSVPSLIWVLGCRLYDAKLWVTMFVPALAALVLARPFLDSLTAAVGDEMHETAGEYRRKKAQEKKRIRVAARKAEADRLRWEEEVAQEEERLSRSLKNEKRRL